MKKVILPIVFSIILISGITPAFAQMSGNPPPTGPPSPGFEDNYVHACWTWQGPIDQTNAPNCNFNGAPYYGASSQSFPFSNVSPTGVCDSGLCNIDLPNWIDDLPFKDIKIIVNYEGVPPNMPTVTCHDPTLPNSQGPGTYQNTNPSPGTVMWFFECQPNPNWEEIDFIYDPAVTSINQIEIWTTSYDEPVGGFGIPIDTAALLLASAQSMTLWMIPVITGIGIGVFVIKRRN